MSSKRKVVSALTATVVAISLVAAGRAAADDNPANVTTAEVSTALSETPGLIEQSDTVRATQDTDSAAVVAVAGTTADVPRDASAGVSLSTGTTTVTVTPPNSPSSGTGRSVAPGVVAYPSTNGSATAVQATETGTVRVLTVIADANAPTRYSFAIGVPDGSHLQLEDDGGAAVVDAAGAYVSTFSPPWAKDATGQAVATHYEIDGNALVQVVDHTAEGVQYPVVADPWFGIRLIDRVAWSAGTLQVYPTWWGRYGAGVAARWAAWDEVVRRASGANRSNMRDQFFCHWDLVRVRAPNKVSWNLDSTRPDVGYWTTVARQCNP